VFGNLYPRSQSCDEAPYDKVGGIRTTGGGSEVGEAHGHLSARAVDGVIPGVAPEPWDGGGGLGGGGEGYGGGMYGGCEFGSELAGG